MLLCCSLGGRAQDFFNLTADEVRIDSVLPCFTHTRDLGYNFADSTYTVTIDYPEFVPMTQGDIKRYRAITSDTLPAMPTVASEVGIDRKRGVLDIVFVPLVCREGVMSKLVSFKLTVKATAKESSTGSRRSAARAGRGAVSRYADNSVLSSGVWAKIRVPASGVYHLSDALVQRAGFANPSKVKIYGYGGALVPEALTDDYLRETDDLRQVATCTVDGRRLFYAQGPVSWSATNGRIRNPYSQYAYYFLTENDDEALTVDETAFLASFYPSAEYHNTLYEVDDFAWYSGGRNLYDSRLLTTGVGTDYKMVSTSDSPEGKMTVSITADASSIVDVLVNGEKWRTISVNAPASSYEHAVAGTLTYAVANLAAENTVTIKKVSGGNVRLDYISIYNDNPRPAPDLRAANIAVPEYVYRITNQNHHADGPADMVIIVPTSQWNVAEAERLKALHEQYDSMTVRIVPADELYNEFSGGTPDASAYRRYMKMLYDRAGSDSEMPSYLILFGDGAWDNRMLSSDWRGRSPDDFLLCYEGENSFSATKCFVSDDFFTMLDDGEVIVTGSGSSMTYRGKPDVAVGRFPVRTSAQARTMVDKVEKHLGNRYAGAWQNTIVFMGDDGDNNIHMEDADVVAKTVEQICSSYDIKRVMWDSYERTASSTGFAYPAVTAIIKKYMNSGALMMNYSGHGSPYTLSHEQVIGLKDFANATGDCLPLWFTASCDIMPFDGQEATIGEEAVLNDKGGAVAFFGTTRTVYSHENRKLNLAFSKLVVDPAKNLTIGEAARRAKVQVVSSGEDVTVNKLHYALLGDPALRLALPRLKAVIDTINGKVVDGSTMHTMKAGETVRVTGHIEDAGMTAEDFNGMMTAIISDAKRQVVCRQNEGGDETEVFKYYDYSGTVYRGTDSIRGGRFAFTFVVPKDINYSDGACDIRVHAISSDKKRSAAGNTTSLVLNGSSEFKADSIGPAIYCYLNSTSFTNGDAVNATPYFIAEVNDEDGINAAGNGIGHDLQLIIDGDMMQTYSLNDYFTFDFGSYKKGKVGFSIPQLSEVPHTLKFRAWDVFNNVSVSELMFVVDSNTAPKLFDVDCLKNPAVTSTSFRVVHDRVGTNLDVEIEIFDMSGRHLGTHAVSGPASGTALTVDWDLTINGGRRLGTGVYLYRAKISCDGSDYASKTKKLIVISNK